MLRKQKVEKVNKITEAKKILDEEAKKKLTACQKEIEQVLQKHGCVLEVSPPMIAIVPARNNRNQI